MILDRIKPGLQRRAWTTFKSVWGEPKELTDVRSMADRLRRELEDLRSQHAASLQELEQTREERLKWIAKESSVRKEFQECQERSNELLEQVVRLTHQERMVKQNLFDQQFKTATTPLERNRFEMELTEARTKVKEAEDRARKAEEKVSRLQELERQARRLKQVESDLGWAKQQAEVHYKALAAAIGRVRELESRLQPPSARKQPGAGRTVPILKRLRRFYHRPEILPATQVQKTMFRVPGTQVGSGLPSR